MNYEIILVEKWVELQKLLLMMRRKAEIGFDVEAPVEILIMSSG